VTGGHPLPSKPHTRPRAGAPENRTGSGAFWTAVSGLVLGSVAPATRRRLPCGFALHRIGLSLRARVAGGPAPVSIVQAPVAHGPRPVRPAVAPLRAVAITLRSTSWVSAGVAQVTGRRVPGPEAGVLRRFAGDVSQPSSPFVRSDTRGWAVAGLVRRRACSRGPTFSSDRSPGSISVGSTRSSCCSSCSPSWFRQARRIVARGLSSPGALVFSRLLHQADGARRRPAAAGPGLLGAAPRVGGEAPSGRRPSSSSGRPW